MAFSLDLHRLTTSTNNGSFIWLFLSGLACYFIAIAYNVFIAKRSVQIKHLFNITTGLLICYFNFGFNSIHSLVTCLATWATIKLLGPTQIMVGVNFIFCMSYLLWGYYEKLGVIGFTWTLPQCVLTLSLIAVSFDVYDGRQNLISKKKSQKLTNEETALENIPSLIEVLSKVYFPPSFLIGPQVRFKDFLQFTHQNENLLPLCWKQALIRLSTGVIYLCVYQLGQTYWSTNYFLTEDFKSYGMFTKLTIIALINKIILCKYISGWLISEGSCIMYGISRDPKTGLINRCFNVNLFHYETTHTFRGIVESFNISTNDFAARYIFKRLKFLGSKFASQFLTLFFLAIWHGYSLGYYNTFALEMMIMKFETDITSRVTKYRSRHRQLDQLLNTPSIRWTIYLLMRLHVIYMFSYAFTSFALLDYSRWSAVLSDVHYVGHIFYFSWILVSPFIPL